MSLYFKKMKLSENFEWENVVTKLNLLLHVTAKSGDMDVLP
jgi:hypothetical protein